MAGQKRLRTARLSAADVIELKSNFYPPFQPENDSGGL
jgi:hypothetical protein